jgi:hypothetical protein
LTVGGDNVPVDAHNDARNATLARLPYSIAIDVREDQSARRGTAEWRETDGSLNSHRDGPRRCDGARSKKLVMIGVNEQRIVVSDSELNSDFL